MTNKSLNSLTKSAQQVFAGPHLQGNTSSTSPFSLRFTPEEREELNLRAGSAPLGSYIKSQLFDGRKLKRKRISQNFDSKSLARALALLGQTRIASNLNQIARASHIGLLPLSDEIEHDLKQATEYVSEIRMLLINALGLNSGGRS